MRNKILIYNDCGTNDIRPLSNSLAAYFAPEGVTVQTADADAIIRHNCLNREVLAFFMPGGRATPYLEKLKVLGNSKIAEYVYNGGVYFGICAGAYYASRQVYFETDVKGAAITQQCGLNLIDADAIGSLHKEFAISPYTLDFNSYAAAKVRWCDDKETHIVGYHGGPYFSPIAKSRMQILAEYDLNGRFLPAAVMQKHGAGAAIASGLHIEDSGKGLQIIMQKLPDVSPEAQQMATILAENETSRQALFHKLMQKLKSRG